MLCGEHSLRVRVGACKRIWLVWWFIVSWCAHLVFFVTKQLSGGTTNGQFALGIAALVLAIPVAWRCTVNLTGVHLREDAARRVHVGAGDTNSNMEAMPETSRVHKMTLDHLGEHYLNLRYTHRYFIMALVFFVLAEVRRRLTSRHRLCASAAARIEHGELKYATVVPCAMLWCLI